jgi:methyl-accepting chemotaxis protein
MKDYIIFFGMLIAGMAISTVAFRLTYKNRLAIRINTIVLLTAGWIAMVTFWLGKTGMSWKTGIIAFAVALPVAIGVDWPWLRKLFQPVQAILEMLQNLLGNDFDPKSTFGETDELRVIESGYNQFVSQQKTLAENMEAVKNLDLSRKIVPASNQDKLNQILAGVQSQFKNLFSEFKQKLESLLVSSTRLTEETRESRQSSRQIAQTIDQVAQAITQQANAINSTAGSITVLTKGVENINKGITNQVQAIDHASTIFHQINATILELTDHAQTANESASTAVKTADQGVQTVQQTLTGMEQIKTKVEDTAGKVEELVNRSETINEITETIDDIASQTNLLALNAAIEAARAESQANALTEELLNRQMIIQAKLVNQILTTSSSFTPKYWEDIAHAANLDAICITDADGVIQYADDAAQIGWRFSDDPTDQSNAFRILLDQTDAVVCQPPARRGLDNKIYKYIGIGRKDQKGIVQVGFDAESLGKFRLQVGGFAVVASEVYRLAENARSSAKLIARQIREEQKILTQVADAMHDSVQQVEDGMISANDAGSALQNIIIASRNLTLQSAKTAAETITLKEAAGSLSAEMDVVSSVIENNRIAVNTMTQSTAEVAEAIESIASISEENSAAVEEVSATTNEVSEQVEEVFNSAENMKNQADDLKEILTRIKFN